MSAWWRCGAPRPLLPFEPHVAPVLHCSRRRWHRGKHRTAFGVEW